MLTHENVYENARFAGQVERFHTWPVLRKQTTGEHTWQVMRIWYQIFGPMKPHESEFLLWHDAGELYSGDPPGMVKKDNPEIKAAYDKLERRAVLGMDGPDLLLIADRDNATQLLTRAKVCDLMDLYEFACVERLQGNRFAEPIMTFAKEGLNGPVGRLPRPDFDKYLAYWHRIQERYQQNEHHYS